MPNQHLFYLSLDFRHARVAKKNIEIKKHQKTTFWKGSQQLAGLPCLAFFYQDQEDSGHLPVLPWMFVSYQEDDIQSASAVGELLPTEPYKGVGGC